MKHRRSILPGIPVRFVCVLIVTLLAAGAAFAQKKDEKKKEMPESELFSVTTISVKPEMMEEFEEMVKTTWRDAFIKGGGKEAHVWHMSTGDMTRYVFVEPMKKLSEMGEPGPVNKGLGTDAEAFYKKVTPMVNSIEYQIQRTRPEMSYVPPMTSPPKLAVVIFMELEPGKNAMMDKFLRDEYMSVVRRSGVKAFMVDQTVFGANPDTYTIVIMQDGYADLDKGPLHERVLKPEEIAAMMAKFPLEAVKRMETHVAHLHPEMSVFASPQASN